MCTASRTACLGSTVVCRGSLRTLVTASALSIDSVAAAGLGRPCLIVSRAATASTASPLHNGSRRAALWPQAGGQPPACRVLSAMLPPSDLPRTQAAGVRTAWYVARSHGRGSSQACCHAWRSCALCAPATPRRATGARPRHMVRRAPCAPPLTRSEYVLTASAHLPLYVSSGLLLGAVRLLSVQAGATLGESLRVCDALRRRVLPTEPARDPWLVCRAAPPSHFTHQVTELAASLEYDPGRAMRASSAATGEEVHPAGVQPSEAQCEGAGTVAVTSAAAPIPAPSPPPDVAPSPALDLELDAPSPGGAWGDLPPLSCSPSPAAFSAASPSTPGDQASPTQGTPAHPPRPPPSWQVPAPEADQIPQPEQGRELEPAPTLAAPRKRPRPCAWDTALTYEGGSAPTLDLAHYLRPRACLWDATAMDVFCMHASGALRPLFESTVQQQVTTLTRHFAACRARCKEQHTARRSAAQDAVSRSLPPAWPELAEYPSPPPPSPPSWDAGDVPEVGRAESVSSAPDTSPFPWKSIRAARLLPAERSFSADSGRGSAAPAPSVLTDLSLHSRRSSRASLISEYPSPSPRGQRSPSISLLEPFSLGADTSVEDAGFDVSLPSSAPPDAHTHLHPDTHDFYVYVTRKLTSTNDKLYPPTQPELQHPLPR